MAIIKKSNNTAGEGVEKREPSYSVGGKCKLVLPLRKTVWRFPKKLQIGLAYNSVILLFWYVSGQNYHSKRYMHPYVYGSSIHDSQDMETV